MMCGGKTEERDANEEVQQLLHGAKGEIEAKLGRSLSELHALKYSTQVVRGTNYFIKARVGDGKVVHIRLHKDLPAHESKVTVHSVQQDKGEHDPIEYF